MSEDVKALLPFLHELEWHGEELPSQFTYPFRYTPHPLCQRAALVVQKRLKEMGIEEGKMYGVLVVGSPPSLFFLAAYSGQLNGSYDHPWFVPPVVDYLDPEGHFQKEQAEIVELGRKIEEMKGSEDRKACQSRVQQLRGEQAAAVAEAKRVYKEEKTGDEISANKDAYIRLRQFQKANIHRAKQLHRQEIMDLEAKLARHNTAIHELFEERKRRSEALQQWLFEQFVFLNGRGEQKGLVEIFSSAPNASCLKGNYIPSGAGECCAPKLLQTAYLLGLKPLAMAEFWWGNSKPGHYREPGAFFPACRSKCYPILTHMLQGLDVEPDPASHYDNKVLAPVRVIWEDEYLAVIDKPEGWCSIPGRSDQANLVDEAHRLWPDITGSIVVHRLDQDTSGVMVIAKNARIHRALCQQFERREVKKRYVAMIESPTTDHFRESETNVVFADGQEGAFISLPIGPNLENMPHQRVDFEHGKEAVTRYELKGQTTKGVRVVFYPQTGRTHQLRVHAAAPEGLNAPIVGDRLYGHVADRLYLHAEAIDFEHPISHKQLHFEVPAPF
ncbi:MAG: RNA pseudouridine synthase [Bacteroidaceae bacterium]|nr:RNA pseudouridine synthase [Bacteroidaceae bacterium]